MTSVAVILAGCGYLDGAEVRESVLTLLSLERAGVDYQCYAPDVDQMHVMNHLTGDVVGGQVRNVLIESARIARGEIRPLSDLQPDVYDALVLPGGFGVAKNLSTIAIKGADAVVLPELQQVLHSFLEKKKPIGAICISPAPLVAACKSASLRVTIGDDADGLIASLGGKHIECKTDEIAVDDDNYIVSCPAYMSHNPSISDVAAGIDALIAKIVQMLQESTDKELKKA